MALSQRQKLALNRSQARLNLFDGSVSSTKTTAQQFDFIARMASDTPVTGERLIIGESTNTVWRNFFKPILNDPRFAAVAPHLRYRQNSPTGTLFGKPFSVIGAGNEGSADAIQGITVQWAWWDEAELAPTSFFDMFLTRLRAPGGSRALLTCNPGSQNHHLYQRLILPAERGEPGYHREQFLIEDNPFLDRETREFIVSSVTGLFYRRMILGEWVNAEGAVFETWDPGVMVTDRVSGDVLCVGIDYGTNHPSAGYALSTHRGGLQLSHEWSPQLDHGGGRTRMTDTELADSLQDWLGGLPNPPRFIYADPAAASFREELKRRGVSTYRADNSVVDGIRTMEALLTDRTLTIARDCDGLIDEIPEYRWDPKATERGKDAPIKEKDDHVDAARYALRSSRHLWTPHLRSVRQAA